MNVMIVNDRMERQTEQRSTLNFETFSRNKEKEKEKEKEKSNIFNSNRHYK